MAENFFKIRNGLNLTPGPLPGTAALGDLAINELDGLLYVGNGSGWDLAGATDHTALSNIGTNTHDQIDAHLASGANPHGVTAAQVGLGNVDNTSDLNKPISTATQTAIDNKVSISGATMTGALTLPANPTLNLQAATKQYVDNTTGINFLKTSGVSWDGALGLAGWAAYAESGSRPTLGTGGSPTGVGMNNSPTNPLSGTTSLEFVKVGSVQGQGVSANFTIDNASKAKMLKIEFDYIVSSGTFNAGTTSADSDLIVYLLDVTNSRLIEPSTFRLFSNSSNVSDKYSAYFQTSSDSVNYRLILHVATNGSNNFNLKFDNVVIERTSMTMSTPITDWVQYTPTFNSGFTVGTGGGATSRWFWRRVGDSVQIRGNFLLGDTGPSMGTGNFSVTIPSGLSFDSDKLRSFDRFGNFDTADSGAAREVGYVVRENLSLTTVFFQQRTDAGSFGSVNSTFPFTWAAGDFLSTIFEAPIAGWSSSVRMSDGFEARDIFATTAFGVNQSIPNGAWTDISTALSALAVTDSAAIWDGTNKRFNIPSSGNYVFECGVGFATNGTGSRAIAIKVNGVGPLSNTLYQPSASDTGAYVQPIFVPNLRAGDTVSLMAYQSSGVALNAITTRFSCYRLQSPQTTAQGDVVSLIARGNNVTGQTIPNAAETTVTTYSDVLTNTHGNFSSGIFTAPRAMFAQASVRLHWNTTAPTTANSYANIEHRRNGTLVVAYDLAPAAGGTLSFIGSGGLQLRAGDQVYVTIYQGTGSSQALKAQSNQNYLTIMEVG